MCLWHVFWPTEKKSGAVRERYAAEGLPWQAAPCVAASGVEVPCLRLRRTYNLWTCPLTGRDMTTASER